MEVITIAKKKYKRKKCTKSVGVARKRCKGKKGYKLKKCMRRTMCGSTKKKRRR